MGCCRQAVRASTDNSHITFVHGVTDLLRFSWIASLNGAWRYGPGRASYFTRIAAALHIGESHCMCPMTVLAVFIAPARISCNHLNHGQRSPGGAQITRLAATAGFDPLHLKRDKSRAGHR